ncbi:MAG: MgtC/SapB family protein [Clostridia bacterium]|nr:MgtC/SapB family protein [Clostridia bacterium]
MNQSVIDPLVGLIGNWAAEISLSSILLRIGLSALLSAVIGTERSNKRHSAGLRTFMLVSLAGTIAMMVDLWLYYRLQTGFFLLSVASVVSTTMIATNSLFISSRNQIKGITTAAGLLVCCFLGISLGAGLYTLTAVAAVAMLLCLSWLPRLEILLKDRSNHFEVHLELTSGAHLREFVTTIRRLGLKIDDIETNPAYLNSGLSVYSVAISITRAELKKFKTHKEIIDALATLDYVSHIEEI